MARRARTCCDPTRNHKTGEVSLDPLRWGLIRYWCQDPKGGCKPINAKCETVHSSADLSGRLSATPLNTPGRWLLRMESHQGAKSKAALCHRHERRQPIRHWRAVGELERPTLHGAADMKSNYKVAVAMLAGVALGAFLVQGLHAQAKPPIFVVARSMSQTSMLT